MNFKGIYAGQSAFMQLCLLLFFVLTGTIVSGVISLLLIGGSYTELNRDPDFIRLIQFLSTVLTFLLPALSVAWLCSRNPLAYLSVGKFPDVKILSLTFISMILFSPVITLTGLLNRSMKLPSFMQEVESWMQSLEASAEELTLLLLSDSGILSLLFNLLVVAVTAGIVEEFFFRGALQRIIGKWFTNPHVTIWCVAFIFSAIHMQFYGFLPRLLLGAYFGYLLYWSRNIWIPVFAHFINNAVAVIGMSDSRLKENEYISGEIPDSGLLPFGISALVAFFLFCYCVRYLREYVIKA